MQGFRRRRRKPSGRRARSGWGRRQPDCTRDCRCLPPLAGGSGPKGCEERRSGARYTVVEGEPASDGTHAPALPGCYGRRSCWKQIRRGGRRDMRWTRLPNPAPSLVIAVSVRARVRARRRFVDGARG